MRTQVSLMTFESEICTSTPIIFTMLITLSEAFCQKNKKIADMSTIPKFHLNQLIKSKIQDRCLSNTVRK